MGQIAVNKVTDATVFMDNISQLGLAEEVDLPTVEMEVSEHSALGMIGTYETPTSLNALETRIKWAGQSREVARRAFNPRKVYDFQIRSIIEQYSGTLDVVEIGIKNFIKGRFKSNDAGKFSPKTPVDNESLISVSYFRQEIDGVETVLIDVPNNIYRVDGVDIYANRRNLLGI